MPFEDDPNTQVLKEFPCPKCGGTERFMEHVAAPEREKGRIPKDMPTALEVKQQIAANPKAPMVAGISAPVGLALWDICWNCGTYYPFMLIESKAVLGVQQGQQGGQVGLPRPKTLGFGPQ
jgi:hypothetical protein